MDCFSGVSLHDGVPVNQERTHQTKGWVFAALWVKGESLIRAWLQPNWRLTPLKAGLCQKDGGFLPVLSFVHSSCCSLTIYKASDCRWLWVSSTNRKVWKRILKETCSEISVIYGVFLLKVKRFCKYLVNWFFSYLLIPSYFNLLNGNAEREWMACGESGQHST